MGLTSAQISILRFAEAHADGVYGPAPTVYGVRFHPQLPLKGAVANTVVGSLRRRGLLDGKGRLSTAGRGALLRDAQAASAPQEHNTNAV